MEGWSNTEGSTWSVGWRLINLKLYYFNQHRYMETEWLLDQNKWYFSYSNGAMVRNAVVDGYAVDSNGVWTQSAQTNNYNFTSDQFINTIKTKFNNVQVEDINSKGYFLSTTVRKRIETTDDYFDIYI